MIEPGECRRSLSVQNASLARFADLTGQPDYYTDVAQLDIGGKKIILSSDKKINPY